MNVDEDLMDFEDIPELSDVWAETDSSMSMSRSARKAYLLAVKAIKLMEQSNKIAIEAGQTEDYKNKIADAWDKVRSKQAQSPPKSRMDENAQHQQRSNTRPESPILPTKVSDKSQKKLKDETKLPSITSRSRLSSCDATGKGERKTDRSMLISLLKEGLIEMNRYQHKIKELGEIGSPSDDDIALLRAEKEKFGSAKKLFAKRLKNECGEGVARGEIEAESELSEMAVDFLEQLVKETDRATGSTELLRMILCFLQHHFESFQIGQSIGGRGLCELAASDGSMDFLRVFLECPEVEFEPIELLSLAFYNQSVRIPCTLLVLNSGRVDLGAIVDDIQDPLQEFFEDVASAKRAIPREDRKERMELLETIIGFTGGEGLPKLDPESEGPDGQTVFTRACFEGDLPLVELLLKSDLCGDVGAPRSSGSTALMAAVVGNSVDVVQHLLKLPAVRKSMNYKSKDGSAMDLARLLKRDAKIVKALAAPPDSVVAQPRSSPRPTHKASTNRTESKDKSKTDSKKMVNPSLNRPRGASPAHQVKMASKGRNANDSKNTSKDSMKSTSSIPDKPPLGNVSPGVRELGSPGTIDLGRTMNSHLVPVYNSHMLDTKRQTQANQTWNLAGRDSPNHNSRSSSPLHRSGRGALPSLFTGKETNRSSDEEDSLMCTQRRVGKLASMLKSAVASIKAGE